MFPALKSCTFAPSTFGSGQGKCFHIYWSLCWYRSSILPVETQRGPFFYCLDVLTSCCTRGVNALNLAGRFAGRRCCRVFSLCFGLTMMCLVYEAKVFHIFCTVFYRFSHCQDRALERDRPQQREKKGVNEPTNSTDIERRRMSTGAKAFRAMWRPLPYHATDATGAQPTASRA